MTYIISAKAMKKTMAPRVLVKNQNPSKTGDQAGLSGVGMVPKKKADPT
jgi:hypothetical protein